MAADFYRDWTELLSPLLLDAYADFFWDRLTVAVFCCCDVMIGMDWPLELCVPTVNP